MEDWRGRLRWKTEMEEGGRWRGRLTWKTLTNIARKWEDWKSPATSIPCGTEGTRKKKEIWNVSAGSDGYVVVVSLMFLDNSKTKLRPKLVQTQENVYFPLPPLILSPYRPSPSRKWIPAVSISKYYVRYILLSTFTNISMIIRHMITALLKQTVLPFHLSCPYSMWLLYIFS